MLRNRLKLIALVALSLCLASVSFAQIEWKNSFAEAKSEARAQNRLIMLYFYTEWCGWCKKLDRDSLRSPIVQQIAFQMTPLKLDAEKAGRSLAATYKVTGYPTILFIEPDGEAIYRVGEYLQASQLGNQLNRALKIHEKLGPLRARLKSHPNDVKSLIDLAEIYSSRGDLAPIKSLLDRAIKADPQNRTGLHSKAYAVLGDFYQDSQQFSVALEYFVKAFKLAKTVDSQSYALLSLASCHLSIGEEETTIRECERVLKLRPLSDQDKRIAQFLMRRAQDAQKANGGAS